jgi:ankyrin repeat protein
MGIIECLFDLIYEMIAWHRKRENRSAEIHSAVRAGDLPKIQAMLKEKPSLVNSKNSGGATPLLLAASTGHREVVELLLASKADINGRDFDGVTPLHRAALYGHKDVVELLLANKADVHARDSGGATPFILASTTGHKDIADLLRRHGGRE